MKKIIPFTKDLTFINDIYETDVTSYYELIHGKLF